MKSRAPSFLRGKRMRATLLDGVGRPIYGDASVVTTKGFVSVGSTTNIEEGEAITQPNANGETCINEAATPTFNGFAVEAEFCEVDFALFSMLTGQDVVLDSTGTRIVGIDESTKVNLSNVQFALELWLGASGLDNPSAGAQGSFGYLLYPFLGGGVISDITVENAAITFTVTGMQTKNGAAWGSGPYNVELVDGTPSPLFQPLTAATHRRIMQVEVAPPEPQSGSVPLLDPSAEALTGVTATPTGLSVALEPLPAGTDPVWYDFGDGTWDYAETGSYTHVYDAAGTYTITARRGTSEVTTEVTVSTV